jgi:hypothetical protein
MNTNKWVCMYTENVYLKQIQYVIDGPFSFGSFGWCWCMTTGRVHHRYTAGTIFTHHTCTHQNCTHGGYRYILTHNFHGMPWNPRYTLYLQLSSVKIFHIFVQICTFKYIWNWATRPWFHVVKCKKIKKGRGGGSFCHHCSCRQIPILLLLPLPLLLLLLLPLLLGLHVCVYLPLSVLPLSLCPRGSSCCWCCCHSDAAIVAAAGVCVCMPSTYVCTCIHPCCHHHHCPHCYTLSCMYTCALCSVAAFLGRFF